MKCHECSTTNSESALFCAHCGAKLHTIECAVCSADNSGNDTYCMACGAKLRRHDVRHQAHQSHPSQQTKKKGKRRPSPFKWTPATIVAVLIGGVLGLIGFMELVVKKAPIPSPPFVETKTSDATLEAKVRDVASKFICSCGTCGEKPLETCTCSRAAEERQFIRNSLQAGQTPEQVITALMNTYGWLKPEFAAKYDSTNEIKTGSKSAVASPTQNVLTTFTTKKTEGNKIAAITDSDEILSHFRCPCGQCGIDELAKCTCNHPRGAKEVKAFVDKKIAEQKYTVAQLVDLVDKKYGGKKF